MSDEQQSLASLFECPICFHPFEDPRMLTCLHTLCHKCLTAHIKQSGKDGQFLCPLCREALRISTKGADDFPKNFFLKNCMDLYANTKTEIKDKKQKEGEEQVPRESVCANSEEGDECAKPEQFCKDCRDHLCGNCSKFHRRQKLSRDHILIPVDELTEEMLSEAMFRPEVPKCQKHTDEQLKLYCDTHQAAVCSICCHTIHKPCIIREISDVDDDVRSELEKAMASLQSLIDETNQQSANVNKRQQSLQSNSSSAIATCDGLFDKMRQMLNQEATQVKDKISKVNDDGAAQVDVQNKNLSLHLQLLDSLRSFVHNLLHKGSVFNRLASLSDLRSRLQHLQSPSQSSAQLAPGINVPSASALIVDNVGGLVLEEEVTFPDRTRGVKVTQKCRVMPDKSDVDVQTENIQIDRPVQAVCEQKDQSVQTVSLQNSKDQGLQAVGDHVHRGMQTVPRLGGRQEQLTKESASGSYLIQQQKKGDYSEFAEKMMAKMGYKEGKGLGKHDQGRADIVEASTQRGRRGLGLSVMGFEVSDTGWDFEKEEVSAHEVVEWLPPCTAPVPHIDDMLPAWLKEGKKKMKIDDETEFCSEETLAEVLRCKTVFDNLEGEEMRKARTKSNPYETIRGVFFLNRAAMKMANMDAVLDYMFTNPRDKHGRPVVPANELLYFADVCAGPGGFSEYVLWRRKNDAKGFGFTLKGDCDFKLGEFLAAPSEMFEPHYGVGGLHGDGDIYKPDNLREFQSFVWKSTEGRGVHFVMADGGFSVDGQENLQEIMSKRLYLCQSLCSLMILRPGGQFVCRLFDVFTPFSVGIIYLMYRAFERVSIFKPVTSRPANSERYLVCQGMRPDSEAVRDYMFELNLLFEHHSSILNEEDICEVVPLDILKSDEQFYQYIYDSNEKIGIKQVIALEKLRLFAQNQNLHETRQADIRTECLQLWKIPDEVRAAPSRTDAPAQLQELTKAVDPSEYLVSPEKLNPDTLVKLSSIYNYRCMVAGSDSRCLLISRGKTNVFKWERTGTKSKWSKVEPAKVELPRGTILEVEFVKESRGEGRGQLRQTAIHILDAMFLCGVDIRENHFNDRVEKIKKFVKAITRPTRADLTPVKVKDVYRFEEIGKIFERLDMKTTKKSGGNKQLCYCREVRDNEQPRFYLPTGVYFIKMIKEPWTMQFSKKAGRKYFFNTKNAKSTFDIPLESIASYQCCQQSRAFWAWENGVKVHDSQINVDIEKISKEAILDYVASKR